MNARCAGFAALGLRPGVLLLVALLAMAHISAYAQLPSEGHTSTTQAKGSAPPAVTPPAKTAVDVGTVSATDQATAARKKLLADTHMLLTLSRELQAEAAKSTPNTFSLNMIKKSEEIQRLAAVVKAEMAKLQ